ncbi:MULTISPECIES: hypothetical protein [Mycobacterium avium complex (MAC)]|uniref:WXG100 family type VII secretion target n=1 Tax=Mycobacterium intracellulare subsp. chimaera TaxID=222805 RepID=A0ABT7P622_MYCIT|nr:MULTISPECIES: hypothetical protein [Mycobacterium avium complex (MAC)]AOS94937.1 hypothetical protein AN480_28255 [Mycobacterium intracellulare subsp. chimaera]MDM3928709.1 hypothetical protein [Mycobacterium intracellulare subsp. chimaera]PBA69074.1 hypothetical protein CKJ76_24845 [Mycobacterium avium]
MSSDVVLYNLPHIEGALAQLMSLNAQAEDHSHTVDRLYNNLDEVSAGNATNRGMEFSQHASQIRAQTADIVQSAHTAVRQSAEDQQGVDSHWAGLMGM